MQSLKSLLKSKFGVSIFEKIPFSNSNFDSFFSEQIYANDGVYYLITEGQGNWVSIVELNVRINNPFYLYDTTKGMSNLLNAYALSFHLHDSDVLYYNLDYCGENLDGYSSEPYYFLKKPLSREETALQRHNSAALVPILPIGKDIESLNSILSQGFWAAFDNNDLDEYGLTISDKYFADPEDILFMIAKYLELYSKEEFPLISFGELSKEILSKCYLLKANRRKSFLGLLK